MLAVGKHLDTKPSMRVCSLTTLELSSRMPWGINTLRPRQNGRHFADDNFKCIFLNENAWIPIKISQKFVPQGPINNIPALVQIMTCCRPGDKPLSWPMMVRLQTHICVTRPQWVNLDFTGNAKDINCWNVHNAHVITPRHLQGTTEFKLTWDATCYVYHLFHQQWHPLLIMWASHLC